MIYKIWKWKQI